MPSTKHLHRLVWYVRYKNGPAQCGPFGGEDGKARADAMLVTHASNTGEKESAFEVTINDIDGLREHRYPMGGGR